MSQHATFLLLGLANGAVFAALGLALVVTHRSTKVLNFAVSAIALLSATIYSALRRGELLLLIPGLPHSIDTGRLAFFPAVAVTLLVVAGFGLLLYVLIFRPLRTAPAVASAVASLGVSVVVVGLISKREGTAPAPADRIFPEGAFHLGDVTVSKDRVFVALSIVGIALLIWAMWRFTRFGLISRAVSQNEKGAYVSGIPAGRVAAANWMLSSVIAGIAGILIAPIVAPVPIEYTLFIVPALAVATLGGFQRMLPTVAGGLALGMIQAELVYLQYQHSWIPKSGAAELVPLALILIVLVARAKPLPSRGMLEERRLGRAPRVHALPKAAIAGTLAVGVALVLLQHDKRAALVTTLIFAMLALSQVVVTGFSGQISLAQLTFAGVAGFFLGSLTTDWNVPFPLAPIIAATAAMVIGVVFALPAVRVRGLPVAVVTLALAVALEAVWFRNVDLVSIDGKDISGPRLFGLDLSVGSGLGYPRLAFCFLVLGVLVALGVAVSLLRTSRLGAAMLAVRANERAAAAAGINVVRTKIAAFAIGAFIAGLAGSMLAYKQGNVTVASFSVYLGLSLFATAYLAGVTSVSGAMVAGVLAVDGILVTVVNDHVDLGTWYPVIAGLGMIYTVVANPEGIVGPFHAKLNARRLKRQPAVPAPSTITDPDAIIDAPRSAPGDVLLSIRDLTVRYGGVTAVSHVSLDVRQGSITGLIGPNGAGKTTLLDAVTGAAPCDGDVVLDGRSLQRMRPDERARLGLGRTFQSIELYDDLTVRENVAVGEAAGRARGEGDREEALDQMLEVLGLTPVAERPASELSQGTRQLVSIARALAGRPSVLLLDEPAAGLDTAESRRLGARLRQLRDQGIAILLVDHDLQLILDLCDDVQVLDFGELIASGAPEAVRADERVRTAYIGSEAISLDAAEELVTGTTGDVAAGDQEGQSPVVVP
jgi:ABC-type branched-subunit amino acid transport system ATPase component/branched-subunit amino acid ABC-type transport system permease component